MYFTQAFKARCIYSSLDVGLQSALFIDRYSVACVSVFNRNPESLEKGRYGRGKGDAHEAVMGRPALDPRLPQMALFDLKVGLSSNVKYPWSVVESQV